MSDPSNVSTAATEVIIDVVPGYLGIDNGTQGLSVVWTDKQLKVLATGDALYDFVSGLPEGCFEQRTPDWDAALRQAMQQAQQNFDARENNNNNNTNDIAIHRRRWKPLAIGISGQMHGKVLVGGNDDDAAEYATAHFSHPVTRQQSLLDQKKQASNNMSLSPPVLPRSTNMSKLPPDGLRRSKRQSMQPAPVVPSDTNMHESPPPVVGLCHSKRQSIAD